MSGQKPPRPRPRPRPKGFDDVPELSNEEVERRVDVRGGAAPRGPVERVPRVARAPRRQERTVARDSLLLIGLVIVGIVAVRVFLPDGPLSASATSSPSGTQAAIASIAPRATIGTTPGIQTLVPVITLPPGSALPSDTLEPTAEPTVPGPTPTLKPGQTPRPTPKPTVAPTPHATPASTPTPTTIPSATLVVVIDVTNDNGGTRRPGDWTFYPNSGGIATPNAFSGDSAGTTVQLTAGAYYQLTDQGPAGYSTTLSANCASATGGLPVAGASENCTITKDDRQAQVTVVTIVDGGTQSPSDWILTVTGSSVNPDSSFPGSSTGVIVKFDANRSFSIDPANASGGADYTESRGGSCSSGSGLAPGATATCTFTFTFVPPPSPATLLPPLFLPLLRPRRWRTTTPG